MMSPAAESDCGARGASPATARLFHCDVVDMLLQPALRSQTVGDIRRFIGSSRPDMASSYRLLTTFPQKQLEDDTATIGDSGLANAVVTQKLT